MSIHLHFKVLNVLDMLLLEHFNLVLVLRLHFLLYQQLVRKSIISILHLDDLCNVPVSQR